MRKAIYNHTAYLLEQYPVEQFVFQMGYQWDTMSDAEKRRWGQAHQSVVRSMRISGRDERVYSNETNSFSS